MFPDSFRAFVKQRVRWSRNSYRCYLTALWKGWLWKVPLVTKVTVLQILLTPVTMGSRSATCSSAGSSSPRLGIGAGRRLAAARPGHPRLLAPAPAPGGDPAAAADRLVVIMIALPIKLYAFLTMNKQGWLTRTSDQVGGAGQSAATLKGLV